MPNSLSMPIDREERGIQSLSEADKAFNWPIILVS